MVERTKIKIPNVKIPRIASGTRNPPGWGSLYLQTTTAQGKGITEDWKPENPAGEKPDWWTGTQPEWSVFWGLQKNGLKEGLDFVVQARLPGVGSGYYSQVDFLIPDYFIGIEVQGKYWHYGQGSQKIMTDMFRAAAFQGQGYTIIFIDEEDANQDPAYFVKEALEGNDHSHVRNTGKVQ